MEALPRTNNNDQPTSLVDVRLLGVPEVRIAGKAVALRASDVALLAYLLLHRGEATARDSIAFTLWPDESERDARARLRSHLHALLRRGLPSSPVPWVASSGRNIRWNPAVPVALDVERFECLAAHEAGLADAVDVYRGDLLHGLDDEWILNPRERLRERYLNTLLQAAIRAERLGDTDAAIRYSERLLTQDPWNEEAMRLLGRVRSAMGDRARAIRTYRDFVHRLNQELGIAPSAETTALYEQISRGDVSITKAGSAAQGSDARPTSLAPIHGREHEVQHIAELLRCRALVTLTGPGGVGKSRIAQEVARRVGPRFQGGVRTVEFAVITIPAMVLPHVAVSLGLDHSPSTAVVDALAALIGDDSVLIVFETCEHLVQPIADLAERLLSRCRAATILATSREALRVAGEWVEIVHPLALPDSAAGADPGRFREDPAVQIFLDRAIEASPSFRASAPSLRERNAIAEIVRRLDGLPLAIQLAAARTKVLPVEALARRLDERFSLLTSGPRTAHPRQQTLRATIDWSYELLTDTEREAFVRCGVFAGTWTLEATGDICFEGSVPHAELITLLSSLVDKSLVALDWQLPAPRYYLLDTLKTYANERLDNSGRQQLYRRHALFFADLAQHCASPRAEHEHEGLERVRADWANFMAALEWTLFYGNDAELGMRILCALRRLPGLEESPELQVWDAYEN